MHTGQKKKKTSDETPRPSNLIDSLILIIISDPTSSSGSPVTPPPAQTLHLIAVVAVKPTTRHGHGLATCIRALEKLAQLLPENVEALRRGRVGHAHDRAPEVERVRDVGADTHEEEEDEVHWVAEDCIGFIELAVRKVGGQGWEG